MSSKVIPFVSRGPGKKTKDGNIIDQGKIGNLHYDIYSRGVIHIFDKECTFKKDCTLFEEELDKLNLSSLNNEEEKIMEGSGDNDNLIFKKKNGDIELILRKKEFDMISKLRKILTKGKK